MNSVPSDKRRLGFTLIELLVALGIFLLITGAAFTLLGTSQKHYLTESQVLTSFQEARLGLDQIVRDVNDSGYPPPTFFNAGNPGLSARSPFAWSAAAGYPPPGFCRIGTAGGGTCTTATAGDFTPGDFDLIIETNPNPQTSPTVQLQGTTLFRGVADKVFGDDPDADTSTKLVPFVQNVVNNSPNLQVGVDAGGNPILLSTEFPAVFPGGAVPIFQYTCDTPSVSQSLPLPTAACPSAATADNSPANIRDVIITLIVKAPLPDATTGQPRLVMLNGRGRRINPNR